MPSAPIVKVPYVPVTFSPLADVVPVVTGVLADDVPAWLTTLLSPTSTSVSLINTLPVALRIPSSETAEVSVTATGWSLVP